MQGFEEEFEKAAGDKDGYLDYEGFFNFFKKFDPNFYSGFARQVIDRINYDGQNVGRIDLDHSKEYYTAFLNKSIPMFMLKYQLLAQFIKFKQQPRHEEGEPSAAPVQLKCVPMRSRIRVKIGQPSELPNKIDVKLRKHSIVVPQNRVRVVFPTDSPQKATKLAEAFNEFHKSLKQAMIAQIPESEYILKNIKFQSKAQGPRAILTVCSQCQQLDYIINLMVGFTDQLTDSPTELNGSFHLRSGVSLKNIVAPVQTKQTMYDFLSRDLQVQLNIETNEQVTKAFNRLLMWTNPNDLLQFFRCRQLFEPQMLALYFCNTRAADIELEFENTQKLQISPADLMQDKEVKAQIIGGLGEAIKTINQYYPFGRILIQTLIQCGVGVVQIDANVSSAEIQLSVQLNDLSAIYHHIVQGIDFQQTYKDD